MAKSQKDSNVIGQRPQLALLCLLHTERALPVHKVLSAVIFLKSILQYEAFFQNSNTLKKMPFLSCCSINID